MNNITRTLLLCSIAIVLFGSGYGVCLFTQPTISELQTATDCPQIVDGQAEDTDSGFQAGWDAAKARLKEANFLMEPDEVSEVEGEIVSLSKDNFELKITPLYPLADPDLDLRKIKIDAQTEIYALKQKDFAEYEKEMQIYETKMNQMLEQEDADLSTLEVPPDFYEKEKTTISELQQNQEIKVIADTNIKNFKEFVAKEILIEKGFEDLNTTVDPGLNETGSTLQ